MKFIEATFRGGLAGFEEVINFKVEDKDVDKIDDVLTWIADELTAEHELEIAESIYGDDFDEDAFEEGEYTGDAEWSYTYKEYPPDEISIEDIEWEVL